MKTMNDIQVVINNKQYTLCGYESGEYLQKVASYINNKFTEFRSLDNYNRLDADMRSILLDINIADDYFKTLHQVSELEEDIERKNNEIFDMKHEIISARTKLETMGKELESLKEAYNESQKKIVKLETELEDSKKS